MKLFTMSHKKIVCGLFSFRSSPRGAESVGR